MQGNYRGNDVWHDISDPLRYSADPDIRAYGIFHKNSRFFSNIGNKTRIIRIVIYAFLAAVPVLGAYLPKSPFKFFCMGFGNIWLGFFMFYSVFVLLLFPVMQIIIKKKNNGDKSLVGKAFQAAFVLDIICCTVFGPNLGEGIGREYAGIYIHYLFNHRLTMCYNINDLVLL